VNFAEAESYLFSLGNEVLAMKLGLENIRRLLAELGDPQNKYQEIQVAGTNGKGSVCAFLESICLSAKTSVGVTTSPHLISITERVRINGVPITEQDFARLATRIRNTSEAMVERKALEYVPTYFEQVTAIALVAFAEAGVELAILETGLGGRLDATTAANAEIAAITQIDLDHQFILGETLPEIAAEKAAIITNAGQRVVIGEQSHDAMKVISDRCDEFGIKPVLAADISLSNENDGPYFRSERDRYQVKRLGLLGSHQIENAKVGILLAEALEEHFQIKQHNIIEGLQQAHHPGRLERDGDFIFDGAHNIAGAKALRRYLDSEIHQPVTMIFGAMRDKDISEIAGLLFDKAEKLVLTRADNPRSASPAELFAMAVPESKDQAILADSVAEALRVARDLKSPDGLILITGSLYLIGEAKKILNNC
jgi:dihydrofolate synthase/folylpolyglutamate synthase